MNPLQFPNRAPMERERGGGFFTGHFAYLSKSSYFWFPSKGALPQGPLHGIPRKEMPHHPTTRALFHSSVKVPGIQPSPRIPGSPQVERGPHGERYQQPETFLTYLPVKELPPRPPPQTLFRERCCTPPKPPSSISQSSQ